MIEALSEVMLCDPVFQTSVGESLQKEALKKRMMKQVSEWMNEKPPVVTTNSPEVASLCIFVTETQLSLVCVCGRHVWRCRRL